MAWAYCQDQYIMAMGGPVAIRLEAMETAIRITEPEDPRGTLDKLVALSRAIVADINETQTEKRDSAKP